MVRAALALACLAVACAKLESPPAKAPSAAPMTTATPASEPDPDTSLPAAPPPAYKPSSSSPEAVPITTNAYGAARIAPNAPRIGDVLEDFSLPLSDGGTFSLADARATGPVVLVFYRGFW